MNRAYGVDDKVKASQSVLDVNSEWQQQAACKVTYADASDCFN